MNQALPIQRQFENMAKLKEKILSQTALAIANNWLSDLYVLGDDLESTINAHPSMSQSDRNGFLNDIEEMANQTHIACVLFAQDQNLPIPPTWKV